MKRSTLTIIGVVLVGSIVALIVAMSMTGGADESVTRTGEASYSCADGTTINVQFLADESAIVTLDGTPYELSQVQAASGARYANSDESFVFWEQGGEAVVLVDGEVMYDACRTADAESEPYTTDPMMGYTVSFDVPVGAEVSANTAGGSTAYRVLYAGPQNEDPALTDGWTVTIQMLAKNAGTSLEAFVNTERANIPNAANATVNGELFFGRNAFVFQHETELGNTVTENFVAVDDTTVARITVSVVGARAQQYRATINDLLQSISFTQVETANTRTDDPTTADLIVLNAPQAGEEISSPLTITGEARGPWYFEATFPVVLTNWDGLIIAEGYAEAQGNWMTEEFVPFTATLEFDSPYSAGDPDFMKNGNLILQKSNPSGLPENDDALEIRVQFAG